MNRPQSNRLPVEPEELISYLESRAKRETPPPDFPRRIVRAVLPPGERLALRRLVTKSVTPHQRRRAAALAARRPLRLNLGSAASHLVGWVNVDLVGDGADLAWDLTRPLPFPDGSVQAIFHEHVLEHLELSAALELVRDSFRMLTSGGVLRIGVPDAGAYMCGYVEHDSRFLQAARPARPTRMLAVQEVFFDHGHRSAYDFDTLALLFRAAGFQCVERRPFGDSRIQPCPDGHHRRQETLYVEACR